MIFLDRSPFQGDCNRLTSKQGSSFWCRVIAPGPQKKFPRSDELPLGPFSRGNFFCYAVAKWTFVWANRMIESR